MTAVLLAPRPRRGRNRQGGFTLIEVMIAMLLLLVGVAGVLSLQMVSVRATSFSRHATEATIVAEDKMEELMSMGLISTLFVSDTDTVDEMGRTDGNNEYRRVWTIGDGDLDATNTSVKVEVFWMERGTDERSIAMDSQRRGVVP